MRDEHSNKAGHLPPPPPPPPPTQKKGYKTSVIDVDLAECFLEDMKLLSQEEEDAHYHEVLKGGTICGVAGLVGGLAGVMAASRRFTRFRSLPIQFRGYIVTSCGTFLAIVGADHGSRVFELRHNPLMSSHIEHDRWLQESRHSHQAGTERLLEWVYHEKYKILGAAWVFSISGSLVMLGRNRYLTSRQKMVQARVYAQGLTIGIICVAAAFERRVQSKEEGPIRRNQTNGRSTVVGTPIGHRGSLESDHIWKEMVSREYEGLKRREREK
ncbi:hypothetical protein N7474_008750 [Penicillium riverlandense]|uniref:uncharacterized protein n=1 Tax=Penicillium riverlandense TaxID=1903569 RepID=UPI002547A861|nr:uncharacterized protein N7474_008750 [Penicillium riverlandense]KAJ5812449.1 hypothetical protein N7474_008750 [Penicillium riverlandense]